MIPPQSGSPERLWHTLWPALTAELAPLFDTHFVCATIALELAAHTGCEVLVGISNEGRRHYDIWLGAADGELKQERWPAGDATVVGILDQHEARVLEKLAQPASDVLKSELWLLVDEDMIAVPLPLQTNAGLVAAPGLLCLLDPPADLPLSPAELTELSAALTVYLDRAELRRQVDRKEVEFAVISDISATLTSTLGMAHVFEALSETIRRMLLVESVSVGLREPQSGDIVFADSLMGSRFENLPEIRVRSGQGIAGWVAERGEPVIINDAYADDRFYRGPDQKSGFRTRSMICIPLQLEDETIGVLQAINRRYGNFSDHDLQLLQAISGPLAAAIANSRLHADVLAEKRRVETIFSSMSDGLLAVSADGYITRDNEAMRALLLSEEDSLSQRPAAQAVSLRSEDVGAFVSQVVQSNAEAEQMVDELRRGDGTLVPVLISGAPIQDEQGGTHEVILTFSDLSQIREVERMREDLFHAIAHELRTPLATILMYARLLREGKATDLEMAERFLGVIERESDRLQRMVKRMMQLARQQATELERSSQPVAMNDLLEEVLPPLADLAVAKGLTFRQHIAPDLPPILGEVERVAEIIRNLVENAIKFTPSGVVRVDVDHDNESVRIVVADQGIGIPRQALPNLFKRFYRAQTAVDRGIGGTGLGLYMVKQSVDHYNGTIVVSSSEHDGATFTVTFPIFEG